MAGLFVDFKMILFSFFITSTVLLIARIYWVLVRRKCNRPVKAKRAVKTMIVAGSGGHTMEILKLLSSLSTSYYPRVYIAADSDLMSAEKIENFEKDHRYEIRKIPRSREVGQSWSTSVLTTTKSIIFAFPLVFTSRPDLVLCNGPGTCIPICFAAFALKVLGLKAVSVVYIESICRVETLSLSGKILYYFADQILVQWKRLQAKYPRTLYVGSLAKDRQSGWTPDQRETYSCVKHVGMPFLCVYRGTTSRHWKRGHWGKTNKRSGLLVWPTNTKVHKYLPRYERNSWLADVEQ